MGGLVGLVTDPLGRRAGVDPGTGEVVLEIPGAVFSGPGTEPQTLRLPTSSAGDYPVLVVGTAAGPYRLDLFASGLDTGLKTDEHEDYLFHGLSNVCSVRAQLDPEIFATTWAEGGSLSMEQAIAYALDRMDFEWRIASATSASP